MFLNSIKIMNIYCVSIGKNVHVSKWLILCNLKELYTAFKDKHPDLKISFSKFASLRPKWCITVDPKGTHSVCVCTTHQNVKLLLSSLNLSKDYHELLELISYDRNSKECMLLLCESCPGVNAVKKIYWRGTHDSWWRWSSWWLWWWCWNHFPAVDYQCQGWTDLFMNSLYSCVSN